MYGVGRDRVLVLGPDRRCNPIRSRFFIGDCPTTGKESKKRARLINQSKLSIYNTSKENMVN